MPQQLTGPGHKWKHEIKKRPPVHREAWLSGEEARRLMDAKSRKELERSLEAFALEVASEIPSANWFDLWYRENIRLPRHRQLRELHPHAVRMLLSREKASIGDSPEQLGDCSYPFVRPCRRWTPPHAVGVEDAMDGLDHGRATMYSFPPSPSAMSIFRVLVYGQSKPDDVVYESKWRRAKRWPWGVGVPAQSLLVYSHPALELDEIEVNAAKNSFGSLSSVV